MKMTTLPLRHSMNRSAVRLAFLFIPLAFACFALSPQARATCQDACLTNNNTVQGDDALVNNTTGDGNTAIGSSALGGNTTASYNTATGNEALSLNSGDRNTANGNFALHLNRG